jgi:hypothetical protein
MTERRGFHGNSVGGQLRTAITKNLVNRSIRYAPELGLIYLNNPKAGCSTIKFSLWMATDELTGAKTFDGNVHARRADPFPRDIFALEAADRDGFANAFMFSIVRNPYSRILAAYLNKIPGDPSVWETFHEALGLRPDLTRNEFWFGEFLRLIEVAPPELLDGHFRPQTDNLLQPYARPGAIFCLEDMLPAQQFLSRFGVSIREHVPHATQSGDRLSEFCDPANIEIIRTIYAEDFLFGYSTEIGDAKFPGLSPPAADIRDSENDAVKRWIAAGERPADALTDLPDLRTFVRTRGREKKLEIIRTALLRDNNWGQLTRYAKIARRRMQENALSDAIVEKMMLLRSRYEQAVGKSGIFLPMPRIRG